MKLKNIEFELVKANELAIVNLKRTFRQKSLKRAYKRFIEAINEDCCTIYDDGFSLTWGIYELSVIKLSEGISISAVYDFFTKKIKCICICTNSRFSFIEISIDVSTGEFNPVLLLLMYQSQNSMDEFSSQLPSLTEDNVPKLIENIMLCNCEELTSYLVPCDVC